MLSVDLGNLAVGLGTFCVAMVSLYSIRNTERRFLEEKRNIWKQEACQLCATYFSLCYDLSRSRKIVSNNEPLPPLLPEEQQIYTKIKQLKMQIHFLFHGDTHSALLEELETVLNKAFKGDSIPEKSFMQKARRFLDRAIS